MRRLQNRTLIRAVEYLESIGLSVYVPCIDVDTGEMFGALMDYDSEEVKKYRELYENDEIADLRGRY